MDKHEEHSTYEIPSDLAKAAREADSQLRPMVQVVEGGYLVQRQIEALKFSDVHGTAAISASELLGFMEPLHRIIAMDSAEPFKQPKQDISLTGKTGIILLRFVKGSLADLQKLICAGGRNSLSVGTHGTIAGVAAWLTSHFGIGGVISTSLATAILITIAKATKGGFCKMTPAEIEKALTEASTKLQ